MPSRYTMQELLAGWGPEGQARLGRATVVVLGLGGLGGTAALLLARAGVGRLRLVDPDRVSLDNLHRQLLYVEVDAAQGEPKADAATQRLAQVNREVSLEPVMAEFKKDNGAELLRGADLVLDCLDRPQPRFLLNDLCLKLPLPWVHAGVVAAQGQVLVLRPRVTPCLRCWFPEPGEPALTSARDGILGPAAAVMASLQAGEAIKLLLGRDDALLTGMLMVSLWPPSFREVRFSRGGQEPCPVCGY
ncbi:MAG: HesA/MoeB/ThiF family protein [Desulfarculaceae bacterium]|nr:HesA/MoeB/ThiF family protein [Desulfarculaceae bacterium]MCF8047659.1 HesA/MoeB/ThiF family protein [Desulfarculaceae bacterium]MCF8063730.1 HesA/MoeB/ThiF family protein [Desulfarculaceae bacterium]MCF8097059.1 HesA/MoeB/ThiF family protein [Desulfarculaceae bacterium]MCF8121572.1 HesA/MoeB/ThiF family protein [Desulfarculaceae bacterium]